MSNCSTERELNCELNIWVCEQLEPTHTTSQMDNGINCEPNMWFCEHETDKQAGNIWDNDLRPKFGLPVPTWISSISLFHYILRLPLTALPQQNKTA